MRKVLVISTLLLIGIIAPILACSDNYRRTGMCMMEMDMPAETQAPPRVERDTQGVSSPMPWSETKNLSNNEINEIMKKGH